MNDNRAVSQADTSAAVQTGSHAAEKHPNLTLLESGQNPGELLRAAREKAGYTLNDISAQTKINLKSLQAIESGDVSRLPPETFAKGFIKSYCKALNIDPVPVLLSFGFAEQGRVHVASDPTQIRDEVTEPKMPTSSRRLSSLDFDRKGGKRSLGYGIALAAIAVLAVFYIPAFIENQNAEVTDPDAIDPVSQGAAVPPAAQQGTLPSNQASVPVGPSEPAPAESPSAATGTPVFPALQQPSAAVAPGNASSAAAGPAAPAASAPSASAPNSTVPSTPATAASPTGTQAASPVAPATPASAGNDTGNGALSFTFDEPSWVTVRDANDKVLVSQLNQSGSKLEVKGQAPFRLIVGNAKSVTVTANGKPVDLSASIKGEVARVTVQ